jgi:hypothetical protein
MLFVFLALYFALGVVCIVLGTTRGKRSALACGIVTVSLALASLVVWILYVSGVSHWSVGMLDVLLSPMPEALLQPEALTPAAEGSGLPTFAIATLELIVAIILWAIPVWGIVVGSSAPRRRPYA